MFTLTEETLEPVITVSVPRGIEVKLLKSVNYNNQDKEVTFTVQVNNTLLDVANECFDIKAIKSIFYEYIQDIISDSNFDGGLAIHQESQDPCSDSKQYTICRIKCTEKKFSSKLSLISYLND